MSWNVVYFQSARSESYVKEFINKQNSFIKAKFIGMIDFLEKYGPFLGGKYTKKLKKDLFELRITGKEQIRILYTTHAKNIVLLHAFKKKTQKTPQNEIKTALLRLDRILHI